MRSKQLIFPFLYGHAHFSLLTDCRVVAGKISGGETRFKPRVGQINTSCRRLATDATLHCVPWRKLWRWASLTRFT